ncbi:MAG: hypothetical protein HQK67_13070 [Desulfamplus sp.]|nr:hypothetical protein [Desulfamplus sp.]
MEFLTAFSIKVLDLLQDDKSQIILALTFLGVLVIFTQPPEITEKILNSIVSGLLGVAVGRGISIVNEDKS